MTTDALAALLLDPFLTVGEAEREYAALCLGAAAHTERVPARRAAEWVLPRPPAGAARLPLDLHPLSAAPV